MVGSLCLLQLPAGCQLSGLDKPFVDALLLHQLFVPSLLHDLSLINDQDPVGIPYGFQPVRDHKDGLFPRERLDGLHQFALILRVHIGGGLYRDNDFDTI